VIELAYLHLAKFLNHVIDVSNFLQKVFLMLPSYHHDELCSSDMHSYSKQRNGRNRKTSSSSISWAGWFKSSSSSDSSCSSVSFNSRTSSSSHDPCKRTSSSSNEPHTTAAHISNRNHSDRNVAKMHKQCSDRPKKIKLK